MPVKNLRVVQTGFSIMKKPFRFHALESNPAIGGDIGAGFLEAINGF